MSAEFDLTDLINRARAGDGVASELAYAAVYERLKALAGTVLGRERAGQTMDATALVHEAFLRLLPHQGPINDRQHFFRLAARAMRQILVDHARQRGADKRGGDLIRTELTENLAEASEHHDLLDVDQALTQLEALDPQLADITQLHFFGGLTFEEIAREYGTSDRSVRRDWDTARAFLLSVLNEPRVC
jgi:RNA polymerase sigma factor (TIGR02999 family)